MSQIWNRAALLGALVGCIAAAITQCLAPWGLTRASARSARRSAQAPPHVHEWTPYLPPAGGLTVDADFVRAGELLGVHPTSCLDFDYCVGEGDCDYYQPFNRWALDSARVVDWSDGGAGGEFGTVSGGSFLAYPLYCTASDVNCYKAPLTPQTASLTAVYDDDAVYADDAPHASDSHAITIWDFTISNGAAGWLPTLDAQLGFTARIRPVMDHLGHAMARAIKFRIASSMEPGYCINATRETGAPNDTTGRDLKFVPPLPGFLLSSTDAYGFNVAETVLDVTDSTVTVTCLDYAPYAGTITALVDITDLMQPARLEGSFSQYNAQMPVDVNNNYIADASPYDGGGAPTKEDADNDPVGDGTNGDGLSRYEEYRGVVTEDQGYIQTELTKKDVFVRNVNEIDASCLTTSRLGAPVHYLAESGVAMSRIVDFNSSAAVRALPEFQRAIRVVDGGPSPSPTVWGETIGGHGVPNEIGGSSIVYVVGIQASGATLTESAGPGSGSLVVDSVFGYQRIVPYGTGGELGLGTGILFEQPFYSDTSENPPRFLGTTLGQAHEPGEQVAWFLRPRDVIRTTFAHEAGHQMNLAHRPNFWEPGGWHNIMNVGPLGGATIGDGLWEFFQDDLRGEDALQGQFALRR